MGSATSRQREHLTTVIEPVVATFGYDLEDLNVNPAGRRSLVRVVVDGDGGIALDDVAEVSKAISVALDEHDGVMGKSPYVLEVTSPGVDRPLSKPRHWRRSIGRLVACTQTDGSQFTGRIVDADDSGADLDVDGQGRRLEYSAVRSARVQVEFHHNSPDRGDDEDGRSDEGGRS